MRHSFPPIWKPPFVACVHWFRIDGPVGELYDLGVVPDVVRPMAVGFASNEILGFITHDPFDPDFLAPTKY